MDMDAKKSTIVVIIAITILFSFFWVSTICAQGMTIHGFITGQKYREFTQDQKVRYVEGLVDGIFLTPVFNGDVEWISNCTSGMDNYQMIAIFDKYLKEHPEEWHNYMNTIAYNALNDICKQYKKKNQK